MSVDLGKQRCISVVRPSTGALRTQARGEDKNGDGTRKLPHHEVGAKRHVEGRTMSIRA
jgi:hypothetical protein